MRGFTTCWRRRRTRWSRLAKSDIIFTDDHAPVEQLVDSIVLDFLLAGGAEEFRRD